jgi:hypothetical protein
MTTEYALFVMNRGRGQKSIFCDAIMVPIDHEISTSIKLNGPTRAWVNGDIQTPVTWSPTGFVSPPIMDIDYQIRSFASSFSLFEISGTTEAINPPCLLTPYHHRSPRVVEATLELRIGSLFETAGLQSHLWLKTVLQALYYPELAGGIDQSMLNRSRQLRPSVGDGFPFVVSGAQDRGVGVVLLQRQISGNTFAASLWFPSEDVHLSQGSLLLSKQVCEIKGMSAVFQALLAHVL